jgi:putative ABC transport system permease protein
VRVLWVKAPLLLRRHPPVLAAVVLSIALAALAASAVPLVRAGVESESLNGQLQTMSPLAAGLEIRVQGGRVGGDAARRAAAVRFGRSVRFLGAPVLSSLTADGIQVSGSSAPGFAVVPLTRTGAIAHVKHVTPSAGSGVWIADSMAKVTHLRPGGTLRLTIQGFISRQRVVALPISGVYHTLEADRDNPYWANWQQDIRSPDPDSPPPPPFVLMDEASLQRVARALSPVVENRFEFPVDPHGLSFADAQRLRHEFRALRARLFAGAGTSLGCRPRVCETSSSLSAALTIASTDVGSVTPTISLLSAIGLLIAFGLCVAAGLFLVRRRADEAHVLFARGEAASVFASRTGLEALLPALAGLGAGLGVALLALRALAPAGTVTGETVAAGAERAAAAAAVGLICIAVGAGAGFPRRTGAHERRRHVSRVPWEVVPLVLAGALLGLVVTGHGVAHDASGASHPRLAVFLVPVFAVAGAAGLAVRLVRRVLARRGSGAPTEIFLALRRVAATRGLFVAVVVAVATSFGTFAYAATLASSLERSVAEKAFVSNGSDVQGLVDPLVRVIKPFPFPVAIVVIDDSYAAFPSGERVDVIAGDPQALERTLRWGDGWSDDPRKQLPKLASYDGPGLAAIATPGAPESDAIVEQGARIPLHIVGHAPIPGSTAGRPALLVARAALHRAARRAKILDPPPLATGYLWAKGDPNTILPVLDTSALAPAYLTTLSHIYDNASVGAAKRSYRYVKVIGGAAAVLALMALLLYLQARQRTQLIASALVARMGLRRRRDAAALALEAGSIVLLAGLVGAGAATAAASPIAHHVDALPSYAPSPVLIVPWTTLALGLAAAVAAGALLGALAVAIAARSDVAEALRVA